MASRKSRHGSVVSPIDPDFHKLHLPDDTLRRISVANPDFGHLNEDSRDATLSEKQMGLVQAIRLYPNAVLYSMLISTALVMEGFDTILLANFFGLQKFNEKFGTQNPDGKYEISSAWKSGLTNGVSVGEIIGLFATGFIQDKFGYKKTVMGALVMLTCTIFINFFAVNIKMLLVGEILCGIPWGCLQTITTAYASEVCPVRLRPFLTTYVNLCWVMGQLIASGMLRAMNDRNDQWAYRIPFALQWMWPLPIFIGCIFAPESPWWLVRHGRIDDAKASLLRLTSRGDPTFDADKTVAMMQHTNQIEIQLSSGTQYWDCFKGVDLRRTEIVTITWLIQILCGSTFMGYSTVFFQAAGLRSSDAFDMSIGLFGFGAVGTLLSWVAMQRVGRRTLYLWGSGTMFLLLIIIGCCGLAPSDNNAAKWATGSLLIVFTFVYDLTVGPVCYSLVSELSSTRLKAKSIVIARICYNIGMIVAQVITNYQLTSKVQGGWNWGAKSAFFWAGTNFVVTVWEYFRLPEPMGRSYGELAILFERGISARKFKDTAIDIFRGDSVEVRQSESDPSLTEKLQDDHEKGNF